jgi:putative spermidine/putrescine transport system substrate-binding protein
MKRRTFINTLGGAIVSGGCLSSCQDATPNILRIRSLKHSLPPQLVGEFTKSIQPKPLVEMVTEPQLRELLKNLQEWQKEQQAEAKGFKLPLIPAAKDKKYIPNLATIGDSWLSSAIKAGAISPLNPEGMGSWGKLDPRWQALVRLDGNGNRSQKGQIWGIPYRWGTMLIIYRRDRLQRAKIKPPADWADLWKPEFKQKISVLADPRATIGLTLKKLGQSFNTPNPDRVPDLALELAKLHQQVKFYSSDRYLQALAIEDTWVAVGWSSDIIDLITKNTNYGAVIPPSGTALWADLWVQPASAESNPDRLKLAYQWIDYCLQPENSDRLALFASGASPLLVNNGPSPIVTNLQQASIILPPKSTLDRSEFISPLPTPDLAAYDRLWQQMFG